MASQGGSIGMRRARFTAAGIVGSMTAVGLALTVGSGAGSVARDLGLAVVSGGIVGGALVTVESMLAAAADRQAARSSLLAQLSTTENLNGIDLTSAELEGVYLPGRAMVAARLEGANLKHSKLYFSDLRHADMKGARLSGADLSGSTLAHADLTGADLRGSCLDDVDLTHAVLKGADLSRTSIRRARLCNADLSGAAIEGATLRQSLLAGATMLVRSAESAQVGDNHYDPSTKWPVDYQPARSVQVIQDSISSMDLAGYLVWRTTQAKHSG